MMYETGKLLEENEIVVSANAVKYHGLEYHEKYVTITQNRTRRRVYNGYYFEDTGTHIYVSTFCSNIFQHKRKERKFIVNTVTKEWRDFVYKVVEVHVPERINPVENNTIPELKK